MLGYDEDGFTAIALVDSADCLRNDVERMLTLHRFPLSGFSSVCCARMLQSWCAAGPSAICVVFRQLSDVPTRGDASTVSGLPTLRC